MSKSTSAGNKSWRCEFIETPNRNTMLLGAAFAAGGLGLLTFATILTFRARPDHMTPATVATIALTGILLVAVGVLVAVVRQKLIVDRFAGQIGDLQPLVQPWAPRFRSLRDFATVNIRPTPAHRGEFYLSIEGSGDPLSFAMHHALSYDAARRIGRQIASAGKLQLIDRSREPNREIPSLRWFEPLGRVLMADGESESPPDAPPGCRVKWTSRGSLDVFELPAVGVRWRHLMLTLGAFGGLLVLILKLKGERIPGNLPLLEVLTGVYVVGIALTLLRIAHIRERIVIDATGLMIERRMLSGMRAWEFPLDELELIEPINAAWRDVTLGPLRATSMLAVHGLAQSCVFGVGLTQAELDYLHAALDTALARRYAHELNEDADAE